MGVPGARYRLQQARAAHRANPTENTALVLAWAQNRLGEAKHAANVERSLAAERAAREVRKG